MPYVRKRGKQLVIVRGKRDPETKKVEQQILFTIYSKAEAQQILGRSNGNLASQFHLMLENQYPDVRFNWRKLNDAILLNIHVLPDLYQYKETRLRSRFRGDLCAFARQLMLTDPQDSMAASHLIEEHVVELEYLAQLIQWRLDLRKQEPNHQKTIETGRKHFPKKISRKRYWSDLSTRPYMRGLRNLTIALNRSGRYEDALMLCDRLEDECMDEISATAFRAIAYLNLGNYKQAADSALKIKDVDPSEGLGAGFALYELGRTEDALAVFLHGALNYPRATRVILGIRTDPPQSSHDVCDHNAGIDICRDLNAYLQKQGRKTRSFFKSIMENGRIGALLNEMELVIRRWREQHPTGAREAFDRMKQMQQPEFARQEAQELLREGHLEEKYED
ncbi:MAG: hypothetical protein U5R49_01580 [Deltaproteobacteria bacterium]|nr:hypothetical protein [Deltaproteobacteria bacterium]